MSISAFIPVKKYVNSKVRLASILNQEERQELAKKMAHQTVNALIESKICESITLVTNDPDLSIKGTKSFISKLPLNECLNEAIKLSNPEETILIMHADLPRVKALELQRLKKSYVSKSISIVSDAIKSGTNCLMFNTSINFALQFGANSYQLFIEEFKSNNLDYQDIYSPALQDDLDSEEDYFKLIKYVKG